MKDLKYLAAYIVPLFSFISLDFREVFSYSTLIFVFVAVPLLEPLLPSAKRNLTTPESNRKAKNMFFEFLLYLNIEHYGLQGVRNEFGRYERVQPWHSWNSNHELGRILLYELTRHYDHHYLANKKYQLLDHHDNAKQLPFGYPTAMLVSLLPPLWFKLMNSKI